jgi:ABC-type dipeptide/oligopeptide/nickel transport system permease subunit
MIASLLGPLITPNDPLKIDPTSVLQQPSRKHWFGTDDLGRDVFSRVVNGGRLTIGFGLFATIASVGLGLLLGLTAGYVGGLTDSVIMRLTDLGLAFPRLLLALGVVAVLGVGLGNVVVAVTISSAPFFIRVVRSVVLQTKEHVYVEAARSIGASDLRILYRHILPNIMAPILVLASLGLSASIFSLSSLGFLGLGAQPPTPEWGVLVSKGRNVLSLAWWMSTFPGLAIACTILAINFIGDGLRDIFDPRLID